MKTRNFKMKKLSKKTLYRSWVSYSQHNLTSMSFDRLQAFGYCWSMLPVINELYKDPKDIQQAMKRHSAFYNTEPQMGVIINGITIGMEEQRANGEMIDDTTINSIKLGLMGPIAGIGDSMIPGTFIPILLSIALLLSNNGNPLGAIFYIVTYISLITIGSYKLFYMGYNLGLDAVTLFTSEKASKIREGISRLGILIMGGIAASYVHLTTTLNFEQNSVNIQVQPLIDNIFPKLLPLLTVILCWYLMSKKGVTPIRMMIYLFLGTIVGVLLNVF